MLSKAALAIGAGMWALFEPLLEKAGKNVEMIMNAILVGRYSESDSRPLLRINSFYSNQIIVDLFYL
jgi:hypothetical protein